MTAPLQLPPLPEPALARWQPLRVGLVELYHYDCEEFWFRDGHLLLRGNNGTGKSKVLSLTLPFLLDAHLSPSRVEPDGDRAKRMDWNLLMGRHERRTGYAWIEFGRRNEEGEPQYLTLGCGLSAVAGRPRPDAWHFITEQRVGRELWLITPERVVLGRERLAEHLGNRGHIFPTAQEYRRAVDERLFHMGEERYRALMDTLITLRHPQLSRRPDEQNLSTALTEALSPLPQATLEDVAEAMTQLDEYHDALRAHEALRDAVAQFGRRYRIYARVQARRQARVLRQAQTEFDNASRALSDARGEHAAAERAVAAHGERYAELERKLARDRAALEELQQDPVMRDARRLHEAEHAARERARDAKEAGDRHAEAEGRHRREQAATESRQHELERTAAALTQEVEAAERLAVALGIAAEHAGSTAPLSPFAELSQRTTETLERVHLELRGAWQRRREHLAQIRQRLGEVDRAAASRDLAGSARDEAAEAFESAMDRARTTDAQLRRGVELFLQQWQNYLDRLAILTIFEPESAMDALSTWAESQAGDNPVLDLLRQAQQDAASRLADNEAGLTRHQRELREKAEALVAERERLAKGEDRTPPPPHTRAAEARNDRDGAPLWRLVEFPDRVSAPTRAGLEAALEAAGLLDAWVLPDGTVLDPHTYDVLLTVRAAREASLRDWLIPAEDFSVSKATIEALLAGIDCASEDPGDAEAWVSPSGSFRLGPVRGAWSKADAEYVGFAAREKARRRRMEQVVLELASLTADLEKIAAELQVLEGERRALNEEFAQAPNDGALREAHAQFSVAELHRREAQERLARADARWNQAEDTWRRAAKALERDAQDLRVPADAPALAVLESSLAEYPQSALSLVQAAREHRRALFELHEQEGREHDANTQMRVAHDDRERRARAAEEAEARRDELRGSVGAAVAEIEQRLARRAEAVRSGETLVAKENENLAAAREKRAQSAQKATDTQQALEERSQRRQEAVEKLRAFARTGLLSVALPDLGVPDPAEGWTIDPALSAARRTEQALAEVASEDADWTRIQSDISRDLTTLTTAMSVQGHQAQAETSDFGLIVEIVYLGRPERPDLLERRLETEIAERREILTAREREILENHLQAEVAAGLQRLLQDARRRVDTINAELQRRPTSTGVRFKLEWQPLPEGEDGAPVGLAAARGRLLNTAADAWSVEDRRLVGEFLHSRIKTERSRDDGGALLDHLSRALDYRRWHRFRVKRYQDGEWRPLSGPASSGERALGLTVPLFAAASSHYASVEYPYAPRLVLLDEAFAGIDDEARAHCMALIREFDLDFVMTSEREWGCYAELPGLAICNLVRREGVDAVFVSRWSWDGRARLEEPDPSRRFPEPAIASA
jgi:uncharacterized protein (TIGR02680 family)